MMGKDGSVIIIVITAHGFMENQWAPLRIIYKAQRTRIMESRTPSDGKITDYNL